MRVRVQPGEKSTPRPAIASPDTDGHDAHGLATTEKRGENRASNGPTQVDGGPHRTGTFNGRRDSEATPNDDDNASGTRTRPPRSHDGNRRQGDKSPQSGMSRTRESRRGISPLTSLGPPATRDCRDCLLKRRPRFNKYSFDTQSINTLSLSLSHSLTYSPSPHPHSPSLEQPAMALWMRDRSSPVKNTWMHPGGGRSTPSRWWAGE